MRRDLDGLTLAPAAIVGPRSRVPDGRTASYVHDRRLSSVQNRISMPADRQHG